MLAVGCPADGAARRRQRGKAIARVAVAAIGRYVGVSRFILQEIAVPERPSRSPVVITLLMISGYFV